MGGAEIFLILSLIANGWQFYDRGNISARLDNVSVAAEQCQESKGNNRITELRSADERAKQEGVIQRITIKSKQHVRDINQMGSDICAGAIYPGGSGIVEESIKRSKAINREWMRGSGLPDD